MPRINGFRTTANPAGNIISKPAFETVFLPLNIIASVALSYSPAIEIPQNATNITIQFFHTIGNNAVDPCTITIEQGSDGVNFAPVPAFDSELFTIASQSPTTTISIVGVLAKYIRFKFENEPNSFGVINACTILFA